MAGLAGKLQSTDLTLTRSGHGEPVVLVHCLGADRRLWDGTVAALAGGFELLRYDLPGHGTTATPHGSYAIADLSLQLDAVLTHALVRRATLVGLSIGGILALDFAA
ncbi:MAG TPA: alpha/beta fold hydrolase, partial [Planctomycetaceae bacterium]|nr:alpha/beta fold hydrolase [Planctomycetaceae bacterium]